MRYISIKQKIPESNTFGDFFSSADKAEREGFEPPVPRGTTVFKTAAFDHSAISPIRVKRPLLLVFQCQHLLLTLAKVG